MDDVFNTTVCMGLKVLQIPTTNTTCSPQSETELLQDARERRLNKIRGLPANENAGIIADVLTRLRAMVEETLGYSINAVGLAMPCLRGLPKADVEDAMEYAGLRFVQSHKYHWPVSPETAADVVIGLRPCANPRDTEVCEDEEENILVISLTEFFFSMRMRNCDAEHQCRMGIGGEGTGGGLANNPLYSSPDESWERFNQSIYEFVGENGPDIDRLQLLGEDASNEEFLDILHRALIEFKPELAVALDDPERPDPLSLAAKGTAILAKWYQEMTYSCKEPTRCKEAKIVKEPVTEI